MKNYRYGVIAGKFRILHKAHKEFIINAVTENIEELHIIICDKPEYDRYSSINELQYAFSEILREYGVPYYFHLYNEIEATTAESANEYWDRTVIDFVKSIHPGATAEEIVAFNSKEAYKNKLIDNKFLKISQRLNDSASDIEGDLYKEENYLSIAPEFAKYINRKYIISGIESSGKTELCRRLADIFDTVFVEEAGRFYSERYFGGGEYFEGLYEPKDFALIAMNQIIQDKDTNLKAKRMVFIDSDPVMTLRLLYFYRSNYIENNLWNDRLESEMKDAEFILKSLIKTYKFEKVFLLEPATFVNDGTRIVISEDARIEQFELMKDLYDQYNITYEVVPFNGDYTDRLNKVTASILQDLGI